jgi:elongation factor P
MAQMIATNELKKGMYLEFDDALYEVIVYDHFKLGKGNSEARIRLKLKNMITGLTNERVFQTGDHLPRAFVEIHKAQYLYEDQGLYYFMDSESFEQSFFPADRLREAIPFLKENTEVELLINKGAPVTVTMPITVNLKVADAPPGFRGDTASAGSKTAKLETGHTVQVPFFVNIGDTIKVDTRTGQYLERVD